jgi:DNA-binding NtrC family response regulator
MANQQERILIVDDEPAVRKLITRILSKEGYQCEEADSATQVLDRLKSSRTELVILDIRMPDKSGIELLPEIKASHPNTAVIMVSAIVEVPSAVQCMKLGAEDYICKPFKADELALTVERTLHKRKLKIKINRNKQSPEDAVPSVTKDKVLACLNSIETPLELKNAINIYTGKPTLTALSAKRIMAAREELGRFRELGEVTVLRGIGQKRFNVIVNALSHQV